MSNYLIRNKIQSYILKKWGMDKFFGNTALSDVVKYAKETRTLAHLWFLSKFPNYAVLMEIAGNKKASGDLLQYITEQNMNVPPLLEKVRNNNNCSNETKEIINTKGYSHLIRTTTVYPMERIQTNDLSSRVYRPQFPEDLGDSYNDCELLGIVRWAAHTNQKTA